MSMLKIELMKLYKRKSTRTLVLLYSLMMLVISGLYFFGETSVGLSVFTEGQFIGASLKMMMAIILPFICLYISSTSFALDFGQGTIKNMFLLPIRKTDIYFGKILAVQSLIGILLGIQFVFSLLVGLALDGGASFGVLLIYLMEYVGAFMILGLVNLAGASLSLIVSSTGLAVFISYLLYIGMGIASIYLPQLRVISISRVLGNYSELFTKFDLSLLLSVVSYYIILLIVGNLIFEKKEESVCQYE